MLPQSRPLRIVHVTGCLDMGGQEKLLVEFARHADRSRFALHFVSLAGRGALAADLEAAGWPVTALEAGEGLRPALVVWLARLFRRCGADVVHTHNERPLIYAAPAARMARVSRCIHTRHGRGPMHSRRQLFLARLAARWVDRYVCVSDDCARLSAEQRMAPGRRLTLRNGIDTRHFADAGPCDGGPAVIVARLCPAKDIGTLLRATAFLPELRLLIAGDGPCLPELQRTTAELGLQDRVQFLGTVRDVAGLLGRASLYVLSSVTEGVSLTLLEAMARGLPVVATRVGGNPEVVADGVTGLLVPPADPAALAAAIRRIVGDMEFARRLGAAGRARVEAHFEIRRMVAGYERLYTGGDQGSSEEERHAAVDEWDAVPGGRRGAGRPVVVEAARP